MAKSMVVVSSFIDATIKEQQKDVTFYLFKTLEELDAFVEKTPVRADTLFFTKDTIPLTNTSLNYLVSILNRVFFKVDKVVYITEPGSEEIKSIKFLVKTKEYNNWEIIQGALTREYVTGVVSGSSRADNSTSHRKAVYRVPKKEYIAEKSKQSSIMEEMHYADDDEQMEKMPDEPLPVYIPPETNQVCECYHVVGEDSLERTLYCFVIGQYLATHGKTLLLERDWEFHTLGDAVTKSDVPCEVFYIDELYADAGVTLQKIRESRSNLIVVLQRKRMEYNYSFVFNVLYNNLMTDLMYAVSEDCFGEEPTSSKYTVVFSNKMTDLLRTCQHVDMNTLPYIKFVGIHNANFSKLRLPTSESIRSIIEDIMGTKDIADVELLEITSLQLGESDKYDLRSALWY